MNNFNDVKNVKLRNFNRAIVSCNLMYDAGPEASKEYLSQFSEEEKKLIFVILQSTRKFGVKKVMEIVTKDIEFEDVSGEEDVVTLQ